MPIGVIFVVMVVVLWLLLFAYWHPGSVLIKGLVLMAVAVFGMHTAGYFVT
jgi:hypothetical protein